jgi:hypothetical protein
MRNKPLSLLVLLLMAAVPCLAQDKRGPSTEEERTKALAAIDDLEKNPLGPSAKEERRWLTLWLIEVPDIHAAYCTDLYPDRPKGDKADSFIISTQMMFSGARYAIQHPGSTADDIGQFIAGVEGSLRTYEVLVVQKPKDQQPALDELLKKRAAGTLGDYVKVQVAARCKK